MLAIGTRRHSNIMHSSAEVSTASRTKINIYGRSRSHAQKAWALCISHAKVGHSQTHKNRPIFVDWSVLLLHFAARLNASLAVK